MINHRFAFVKYIITFGKGGLGGIWVGGAWLIQEKTFGNEYKRFFGRFAPSE
jgi:hypothetical protein